MHSAYSSACKAADIHRAQKTDRGLCHVYILEFLPGKAANIDKNNSIHEGKCLAYLKSESPVLCLGFSALQGILSPYPVAVHKLSLPWLDVAVQIGDQLVLIVRHARPATRHSLLNQPGTRITLTESSDSLMLALLHGAAQHDITAPASRKRVI